MEQDNLVASLSKDKTQDILSEMRQEVCERGGSLSFQIISGSMSPLIEVDDVVRVTKVEPSRVRIGDIVAFRRGQNVIVHRVIGKSLWGGQLLFRQVGDSGRISTTFPAQNLIGIVTALRKKGCEIRLDTPGQVIAGKLIGWRLLFYDILSRRLRRRIKRAYRKVLRLMWRLWRPGGPGADRSLR